MLPLLKYLLFMEAITDTDLQAQARDKRGSLGKLVANVFTLG